MTSGFLRVSKRNPCPVCKRPNAEHESTWCEILRDGSGTLCMFTESAYPANNGHGWMHWTNDKTGVSTIRRTSTAGKIRCVHFDALQKIFRQALNGHLADHATLLGVSALSLDRLGVGWDGEALTFPMVQADEKIVGIRRRFPDGRKLSVEGGREGVFIPQGLGDGTLLVCEGPTDTAAMLDLGFDVIGRPSCCGGTATIVKRANRRNIVIVADNGAPGQRGAIRLAEALDGTCGSVRIVTPPAEFKDARAWRIAGSTAKEILG